MEEWKNVVDFENYKISNFGRVKSFRVKKLGKILTPIAHKQGYITFCLRKEKGDKVNFHQLAHRLVAQAFISNPESKPQINHKNGIKTDNRVENLEWCTDKENKSHSRNNGLANNSKLNIDDIGQIRKLASLGVKSKSIASMYKVRISIIHRIIRSETWNI